MHHVTRPQVRAAKFETPYAGNRRYTKGSPSKSTMTCVPVGPLTNMASPPSHSRQLLPLMCNWVRHPMLLPRMPPWSHRFLAQLWPRPRTNPSPQSNLEQPADHVLLSFGPDWLDRHPFAGIGLLGRLLFAGRCRRSDHPVWVREVSDDAGNLMLENGRSNLRNCKKCCCRRC